MPPKASKAPASAAAAIKHFEKAQEAMSKGIAALEKAKGGSSSTTAKKAAEPKAERSHRPFSGWSA